MPAEALELIEEDEDYDAINLVVVTNPLSPHARKQHKLVWQEDRTLDQYLDGLSPAINWCVCLNDTVISKDDWAGVKPAANDFLVLVPVPEGGGGTGKQILRIVAMIGIAVAAFYTGGAALAAYGPLAGAAAAAAVSIGGSLLVNALLPATSANNATAASQTDGQTYGIDGPKNTSGEEFPVPVIYGEYLTAGNIVDIQIQNDGDTQFLYMRSVISEGPIDFIDTDNLLIENQARANYQNVESDSRLGTDNQASSAWFNQTKRYANEGEKLDTGYFGYTTITAVQGVGIDFDFPNGLATYTAAGVRGSNTITITAQYQSATIPGAAWLDINPAQATFTGAQRAAKRFSMVSSTLPLDIYNIRVKRNTPESTSDLVLDQIYVSDFVEILNENCGLNFSAWYAIKVQLTDQLSSQPNILVPVRGKRVNTYDARGNFVANVFTKSPAWITLDILSNPDYGAGMALSRFDMPAFVQWDQSCAANNLEFNGIFDQQSNIWDASQIVCRVGHASIVMGGTKWTVAIEGASDPVQMFGTGNIVSGSLEIDWLDLSDRANEVEISYQDRNDQFRRHTVRAVDPVAFQRGAAQRLSSIELMGVTSNTQAWIEANFQLNLNRLLLQTVIFDAPLEAIACVIGDVVLVQHDMPKWGYGGRLEPAGQSTFQLTLDRPVVMTPGLNYQVLVIHPAVQQGSTTISLVAGNSIYVPFGEFVGDAMRIKNDHGVDSQLLGINNVGTPPGTTELILDDATGFSGGETITYWRTNKIDTVAVNNPGTGNDQTVINLAGALTQAPIPYAQWMFGPVIPGQKPFRVQQIEAVGDYTRTITGLEYNASAYLNPLDPAPTPDYSILPTGIGQVTGVQWWEEVYYSGPTLRDRLVITWSAPGGGANTVQGFTIDSIVGQVLTFSGGAPPAGSVRLVSASLKAANIIAISGQTVTVDNPAVFAVNDVCSMSTSSVVDGTYAGADIQVSLDAVTFTLGQHVTGSGQTGEIEVLEGQTLYFRIIPFDGAGGRSPANLAQIFQYGVNGKTTVVGAPTRLTATSDQFQCIPLVWTAPPDPDVKEYELWEAQSENLALASPLPVRPTGNSYTRTDLGQGDTRFYWVRAFDHQGRASAFSNPDGAGAGATTSEGITGQQIANNAIDPTNLTSLLNGALASFEPLVTATIQNAALLGMALANISTVATVAATANAATASQINTVETEFGTTTAALQVTLSALSTKTTANATLLTQLGTTVGLNTTNIQETIESINGIQGLYMLQVNTDGVISGFGLASDLINGQVVSTFAVSANDFFLTPPGSTVKQSPFYETGGQVYIQKLFVAEVDAGALRSGTIQAQDIIVKGGLVVEDLLGNLIFSANGDPALGHLGVAIVGTGNVAGNAITIPIVGTLASPLFGNNGYQTAVQYNITMPFDGQILLNAVIEQGFTSTPRVWGVQLRLDNSIVCSVGGGGYQSGIPLAGAISVTAGVHTVQLIWLGADSTVQCDEAVVWALGAMR